MVFASRMSVVVKCVINEECSYCHFFIGLFGWLRGTVVERQSVTGELSLSYA